MGPYPSIKAQNYPTGCRPGLPRERQDRDPVFRVAATEKDDQTRVYWIPALRFAPAGMTILGDGPMSSWTGQRWVKPQQDALLRDCG